MLSTESRRGRRILARLDRGTDLFDGVRALCQKHEIRCGELRAIGALEMAELAAFDQGSRRWKPSRVVADGGLELLHLHGNISEERGAVSIQAQATLMRDRDVGVEVLGGSLKAAVVYSIELVIETFDDVLLRRQADAATGLSRWHEALAEADAAKAPAAEAPAAEAPAAARPAPPAASPSAALPSPAPARAAVAAPVARSVSAPAAAPTGASMPVATPTWAEVAAASQAARPAARPAPEPEPARDEEVLLNAGDVIMHPRFQRCVVHRVEGSGEFVQVMLRNGRVVRLSLEVLRLTPQGVENGQRIFSATVL
jgi:predicted DNA-binding protein with PD1-like motif